MLDPGHAGDDLEALVVFRRDACMDRTCSRSRGAAAAPLPERKAVGSAGERRISKNGGSSGSSHLAALIEGCESGSTAHVKDTNIAYGQETQKVVLVFDNDVTVAEKMKYVLEKKPRKRFAWLYFNVYMTDFVGRCKMRHPFAPIFVLRKNFSIGDKL
ncbi:uncharacterized protein [Dermacentor andersoni]|uniref:uncharacterized protein n=1 Tax=Dermacentor andersoni TaxID=34620 RepID=UPI00241810D5|nr:uncharacterized protein LOC129385848 [Dermacentor andersoni]